MVSKSDTIYAWSRFLDKLLENWDDLSDTDRGFFCGKGLSYKASVERCIKKKK